MTKKVKRLLGISAVDGKAIYAPKHSHSLLLSAAGGGKTSCGAMPWLLSLLPDRNRAIIVNDCKDGEIAAQAAEMCARYGRKVAIIDDFGVLGMTILIAYRSRRSAVCERHTKSRMANWFLPSTTQTTRSFPSRRTTQKTSIFATNRARCKNSARTNF